MAHPLSNAERQHYIDAWQSSKLAKAAFCRQQGISPKAFYHWCKKKDDTATENTTPDTAPPMFIPTRVIVETPADAAALNTPTPVILTLRRCSVTCALDPLRHIMTELNLC